MTKAYIWQLGRWTITTKLVKNGVWRWYSTADTVKTYKITSFSKGSNALTHKGAIKEIKDEYTQYITDEV